MEEYKYKQIEVESVVEIGNKSTEIEENTTNNDKEPEEQRESGAEPEEEVEEEVEKDYEEAPSTCSRKPTVCLSSPDSCTSYIEVGQCEQRGSSTHLELCISDVLK